MQDGPTSYFIPLGDSGLCVLVRAAGDVGMARSRYETSRKGVVEMVFPNCGYFPPLNTERRGAHSP